MARNKAFASGKMFPGETIGAVRTSLLKWKVTQFDDEAKMTPEKWKAMGITLAAVLAVSVGETLLTRGMKQTGNGTWQQQALAVITNRYVLVGTLLMAVYFGLYMTALKLAPLSFVLPLTALSFVLGGVLAKFYLHENVNLVKWAGYLVIMIGVVIVGLGEAGKP